MFDTIGIERILTDERVRRTVEHRRNHVKNVLSMQHKCSPEDLSLVSQSSSRPARKMAQQLADMYMNHMAV